MPYGTVNADVIQSSVSGVSLGAGNATSFKNKIINGAVNINQRVITNSAATDGGYWMDMYATITNQGMTFNIGQNLNSVTPPTGFINYLGCQSTSSGAVPSPTTTGVRVRIEGQNMYDLAWGTANAKTVTMSFWVYSSLTGTFGGGMWNSSQSTSYPFSYSIPTANTWTYITITIAGPTSGTFLTTNGVGLGIDFSLATGSAQQGTAGAWTSGFKQGVTGQTQVCSTNGATWYMTGLQFEVGSSATGFDYRSIGTELALCQRYYEKTYVQSVAPGTSTETNVEWAGTSFQSLASTGTFQAQLRPFKVVKRAAPTMTFWDMVGNQGKWTRYLVGGGPSNNNTVTVDTQDDCGFRMFVAAGSNTSNATGHWTASAEL